MNSTFVLGCMLLAYIFPIAFVYYKYNAQSQETGTRSISSIITSTEPFLSFITRSSSSTASAATAPPPRIPNPSLYRTLYAHHGRIHRSLRIPETAMVSRRHHRPPLRDFRCYFYSRTKPHTLYLCGGGILRNHRVYVWAYFPP